MTHTVGYLVGSLAKASINRKLATALARLAPDSLQLREIPIAELPLYSYDHDADYPAVARKFKESIEGVDALLFVTPEYNRSIPGVLKNAIDWTSRPYGDNAWVRKPVFVIGASIGPIAAAVAQYDLKKVMTYLDAFVMGQPEFYCGTAGSKFNDAGTLVDDDTEAHVTSALSAFMAFIDQVR